MTDFEAYVEVAQFLTKEWKQTPIFIKGQVIKGQQPPFIVYDSHTTGHESCNSGAVVVPKTLHLVEVYHKNRPLCKKLMSDFALQFQHKKMTTLTVADVDSGSINELKESLYEGQINFKTLGV